MIEFGHLSHVGLRRELNEDTYYGDAELGLWLVADGMGGHDSGEVASALARDAIVREVRAGKPLAEAILRANEDIIRQSKRRNESMPMGTTVVAVRVASNHRFELAWVGDSRAYVWNGKLQQVSSDHSYVQELIDQASSRPSRRAATPTATSSPRRSASPNRTSSTSRRWPASCARAWPSCCAATASPRKWTTA
jgi:protein phosphatase